MTATVIITRMPTTGEVTNISTSSKPLEEVRAAWRDTPHVEVLSYEDFRALPTCDTCGCWVEWRRCADCR